MLWVSLNGILIVLDSIVKLSLLSICEPSIVVKIGFIRLDRDSFRETLNRIIIITFPVKRNAFIVVGIGVVWINQYCLRVVRNSFLKLAYLIIGEPSVEQGFKMVWHDL